MTERWRFFGALSIITATTFGVGIFGIPYAVARSGFLVGLFWFLVLGIAVVFLNLLYGSLQVDGNSHKRLISLVSKNLGVRMRLVPLVSTSAGALGAMVAYIIVGGKFVGLFLGNTSAGFSEVGSIVLWFFLALFVLLGVRGVTRFDMAASIALFIGVGVLISLFWGHASFSLIPQGSIGNAFVPYGVILFALYGANAIPAAVDILGEGTSRTKLSSVIFLGTAIPFVIYVLFTFAVLGISGVNTSQDAILGLTSFLSPAIIRLAALVGFLAISTSFVTIGLYVTDTLADDLSVPPIAARMIAVLVPIGLFLGGIQNFNVLVGVVGSALGAIDGILISFIFFKLQSRGSITPLVHIPKVVPIILIAIFLVGIIGEIFTLIAH